MAIQSKISDLKPDVIVLTETELPIGDTPMVPGYVTLLPSVLESNVVRTVTLVKRSLNPQRLDSPVDIPVVVTQVGKSAIIGARLFPIQKICVGDSDTDTVSSLFRYT